MAGVALAGLMSGCAPFMVGPISEEPTVEVERAERTEQEAREETLVILVRQAVELQGPLGAKESGGNKYDNLIDLTESDEEEEVEEEAVEAPIADLSLGVKDGSERRLLLSFDLGALPAGAQVASASLELTLTGQASSEMKIVVGALDVAWQRGQVEWEDQPTVEEETASTVSTGESDTADRFDVTATVQKWAAGDLLNNGLALKVLPEDQGAWKSYHSLESGKIVAGPRLVIKFRLGP